MNKLKFRILIISLFVISTGFVFGIDKVDAEECGWCTINGYDVGICVASHETGICDYTWEHSTWCTDCVPFRDICCCYDYPCVPETCSSLGKDCGTYLDGCGGAITCGGGGGDCCDSNGQYRPSSYVCDNNYDSGYSCRYGEVCGSEIWSWKKTQSCSGFSSSCVGSISSQIWNVREDNCSINEMCIDGDLTCNIDVCNAWVDDACNVGGCTNQMHQTRDCIYGCEDESRCIANPICPVCVPETCSSLGKDCGVWDNGCEGTVSCGDCSGESVECGYGTCGFYEKPSWVCSALGECTYACNYSNQCDVCFPSGYNNDWTITRDCVIRGREGLGTGNLTIASGVTVQINPGATLVFDPGYNINFEINSILLMSDTGKILKEIF